jgi:hypothetical protein
MADKLATEDTHYGVLGDLVGQGGSTPEASTPVSSATSASNGVLEQLTGQGGSTPASSATSASSGVLEQLTGQGGSTHEASFVPSSASKAVWVDVAQTLENGTHVLLVDTILKDLVSDNMLGPRDYMPPHQVRIPTILLGKGGMHVKCDVVVYYEEDGPVFLVHVDNLYKIPQGRYVTKGAPCATMSFSQLIFQSVLTKLVQMNLGQEKLLESVAEYLGIILDVLKHLPTRSLAPIFRVLVATPTMTSTGLDKQVMSAMQAGIHTMFGDLVAARPSDDWTSFKVACTTESCVIQSNPSNPSNQTDVANKCWEDFVRVVATQSRPL